VVEVTGEVMKRVQGGKEDWVPERRKNIRIRPVPVVEQRLADGRWIHAIDRHTTDGGSTVCLRFDITAAKTQEQALLQAQKLEAVGQLTSGVAHEFNNALQVVSGYVELLAHEMGADDPLLKDVEQIDKGVRRATELTKQLLTFTRKHAFQPVRLDLTAIVRNFCVGMAKMLTPNHELKILAPDCPVEVIADRSMIEQILINFGVNARDAMPAGGRIEIGVGAVEYDDAFCSEHTWAKPGRYSMLRFSDTGQGMTPEVKKRVFEPFFTTKDPGKGTGLGLSVVYGIVNQHDGLLRVDSEPGQGTTFEVYLPAA
jgi:signal transduction histidine kinase